MSAQIWPARFVEDGSAEVRMRLLISTNNGTTAIPGEGYPVEQADITSITYKVFNVSADPHSETATGTVNVATAVYDTLQVNPVWTDSKGFNFSHTVPASAFAAGGDKYRVEYRITYANGAVSTEVAEGPAMGVSTS